ncbi:hypothetical protein SESBI_26443 [Sesbania bispinosa]|nr:hypothetical protein SESBI_26443 [Sesbania bispinosa]
MSAEAHGECAVAHSSKSSPNLHVTRAGEEQGRCSALQIGVPISIPSLPSLLYS